MKNKRIYLLLIGIVTGNVVISAPVRTISVVPSSGGIQIMPSAPMNAPIRSMMTQQQSVPSQAVITQQPVMMMPSVQVKQSSQPVSDQVFLENTMTKLLGEKTSVLKMKIEKYKKIIQDNARILEQKIRALFA
jgi:hypothetical protein